MTSIRRLVSSRANAALSTGPKTAAGKRRSSQNGLRHGCRSRTLILPAESQPDLDHLLQDHLALFHPRNPVERALVDQMVAARWRQRRISARENTLLHDAIAAQPPEFKHYDRETRIRIAFLALLSDPAFTVLSRYETTESLRFYRAVRQFLKLHNNTPSICTTEATLSFPYVSPGNRAPAVPQNPVRVHSCGFVAPRFSADKLGITHGARGELSTN
jgi:hypothetical protein